MAALPLFGKGMDWKLAAVGVAKADFSWGMPNQVEEGLWPQP